MSGRRFISGTRFRWQDESYQVMRLLPTAKVNIENLLTGATQVVEMADLVEALFAGDLCFVPDGQTEAETRPVLDLSDYPEEWVAIARYRLEVIQPLLGVDRRKRQDVEARVTEIRNEKDDDTPRTLRNLVSATSIYEWIAAYKNSGSDLRALIPAVRKRGGKDASRLAPAVDILIQGVIDDRCHKPERVTIDDIRDELAVRIAEENQLRAGGEALKMPSRATLARRLKKLKAGERTATQARTQYDQTPYPDRPLERVEIDHTLEKLSKVVDRATSGSNLMVCVVSIDILQVGNQGAVFERCTSTDDGNKVGGVDPAPAVLGSEGKFESHRQTSIA